MIEILPIGCQPGHWAGTPAPLFSAEGERLTGGQTAGPKLLIVEDDHLVAMQAENTLLDAGFEVTGIAATAEEAIQLTRAEPPTLVIMDIRLAGERDGVDTALQLFRETGVRCIFATARNDPANRLRAEPARPFTWLAKPYHPGALVRAVREVLSTLKSS